MKNDYMAIISSGRLRQVIEFLNSEGWEDPTLRGCWYVLCDGGEIQETRNSYKKFDAALSIARDKNEFPYGLLSHNEGTDYRGLLPDELKRYLREFPRQNVPPELCGGILKAVMVEKVGLLKFVDMAVKGRIPVASPQGMVRKEWAVHWIQSLQDLAHRFEAELGHRIRVRIIYIGDCDEYGAKIKAHELQWFQSRGVEFDLWAVQPDQLRALNRAKGKHRHELHADGYIVEIGPKEFGRRLRVHLALNGSSSVAQS